MWTIIGFFVVVVPVSVYLGMRMLRKKREDLLMQAFRFSGETYDENSKAVFEALSKVKLSPLGQSAPQDNRQNSSTLPAARRPVE